MNKIWLIIQREYLTRVKKKSFIIMTILGPLLFGGLLVGAIAITLSDQTEYKVLIVDQFGVISEIANEDRTLVPRFPEQFKEEENLRYTFSALPVTPEAFREGDFNIMVELDDVTLSDGKCSFYFKKYPSELVKGSIRSSVQESLERFRVVDSLQLDYEKYKRAKLNVTFAEVNIDKLGEEDRTQEKAGIGFAFAVLIYLFIFLYGVQVMRGVIEEKTNRIVEVIVSSVRPFQLMMGKVIGIGLVGLTQFLMWVLLSSIISSIAFAVFGAEMVGGASVVENSQLVAAGIPKDQVREALMTNDAVSWIFNINWPLMIGLFIFYFIGGYLLYGSIFAAIGAAVDNETDTQQFMAPVTLPLIFGYIVSAMLMSNPESPVGTFFSIFPFTSPVTMMVKTAIGAQPWLIVVSVLVLIATFLFFIWFAGRIYRVGILMYGKKASWKELWKWSRYRA